MASNSGSGTVWTRRRFAWCWTSYGDDSPSGQCTSVFVPESLRHAPELRRAARTRAGSSPVGSICWPSLPVRQQAQRSAQDSVLGCVTNVSENLQCCTEDGRRPPGVGFQESASNHPELLRSKGVVVNVRGKGVREGRQVSVEKMSESEPSDDASSRIQGTVKTGAAQ